MSKKQEVNHDLIGDIALDLIENDWPNVGAQIQEYVQQNEKREATQTRWVKCSERMPTIVNKPEFAYITIVHVKSKQEELLSMGMVLCDLQDGKLIPAGPGFLPLGWEVVAWLDNVPRYEP